MSTRAAIRSPRPLVLHLRPEAWLLALALCGTANAAQDVVRHRCTLADGSERWMARDLSLVLRSLQDTNDEGREAPVVENAPAEPGDSFTEDSQVSKLIRPPTVASSNNRPVVIVLRGSARLKLDMDGNAEGAPPELGGKPTENKTNKTVFTPMSQSE